MDTERASYTAEDVLNLMHDVESELREGDCHFVAPANICEVQLDTVLVTLGVDTRSTRIRLPRHSWNVPIPPITGSREEWPHSRSDIPQLTPTGDLQRPRIRLPQFASCIQALPVADLEGGWSSPTGNIGHTHVRHSQHSEPQSSLLSGNISTLDSLEDQDISAGDEANDSDLQKTTPKDMLLELGTCQHDSFPNTAHICHAEDMEIDHEDCSTLVRSEATVTLNGIRNKRQRAADLWDTDENEHKRQASKRAKLSLQTSKSTTPIRPGIDGNSFSVSPRQSSLLDCNDLEMGTSSPVPTSYHVRMEHETPIIHESRPSSGQPLMLHPEDMEFQTTTPTECMVFTTDGAFDEKVDPRMVFPMKLQDAGDLGLHLNPPRSRLKRHTNRNMGTPKKPVGLSDLPDDLQDRIFTTLLKSDDRIIFSTARLTTFANGVAGAPTVKNTKAGTLKSASALRSDLRRIKTLLKAIPGDRWPRHREQSRTSDLTRSLLTVSKAFHVRAARIFYGSNTFHFTHQKTCWMHLESFLATIGPKNASHIRHICLSAPVWHPGVRRDAIIGALFDAMNPITRLAAFKVPAEDRLLSAINTCAKAFGEIRESRESQVGCRV